LKFGADVELSHEILDFSKIYQAFLNSIAFPKLLQCQTSTKPFFFFFGFGARQDEVATTITAA
jgi:hypothetical protein